MSFFCFALSAVSTVFTDLHAQTPAAEEPAVPAGEEASPGCVTGAAMEDLQRQRERLEVREKELKAKEAELKVLESSLNEEIKRLADARTEFGKMDELKKKENEEKVAKIVDTVETMSPKPAATLLSALDDALAVTAMQRIATPKLAKMMNVMEPGRSSRLTELLAGVVRARGAEGSQIKSVKGGEKNDGQNEHTVSGGKERESSRRAENGSS